ncbi:MAG: aldehyde dehydrogenase family protein [Actinobacteria bacterium]|nr:aldehyde dehydrogenase family protein [Actinomycetota bacterium]
MAERLDVQKTYKLFIGGAFPRSESGRTFALVGTDGSLIANVAQASRKDLRDAVVAARSAQAGWAARTAYNRGQILYRVAEVMEGRRTQFVEELRRCGVEASAARQEVERAIDRWVWYAGWCDKFHHLAGTVNSVAGPYFNFTMPEPTGVVGILTPDAPGLLGLVSRLAPALVSGNTAVVLTGQASPLTAVSMAEVVATSDVPGGVVNILTGETHDLLPWLLGHRDVNAVDLTGASPDLEASVVAEAAENVKRLIRGEPDDQSPYVIADFCEMKTVWHPVGR